MSSKFIAVLLAGTVLLSGCETTEETIVEPAVVLPPGAIAGTVVADRNGDGQPDGWYQDGVFYPFPVPPPPPPCPMPPPPPPGERG